MSRASLVVIKPSRRLALLFRRLAEPLLRPSVRPPSQPEEGTRAPLYRFHPASHAHEYWNALNLSQFLEVVRFHLLP